MTIIEQQKLKHPMQAAVHPHFIQASPSVLYVLKRPLTLRCHGQCQAWIATTPAFRQGSSECELQIDIHGIYIYIQL